MYIAPLNQSSVATQWCNLTGQSPHCNGNQPSLLRVSCTSFSSLLSPFFREFIFLQQVVTLRAHFPPCAGHADTGGGRHGRAKRPVHGLPDIWYTRFYIDSLHIPPESESEALIHEWLSTLSQTRFSGGMSALETARSRGSWCRPTGL